MIAAAVRRQSRAVATGVAVVVIPAPLKNKTTDILRILSLLLRAAWSRTPSTLPAPYSQRLKLLAFTPLSSLRKKR